MSGSISDLLNNIGNLSAGIRSAFSGKSNVSPSYLTYSPMVDPITSDVKQRWKDVPQDRYVFGIISEGDALSFTTKGEQALQNISNFFGGGTSNASGAFSDFALPITPQEITQTENFATSIKPTQGGTVLQHGGNRYKDLVISGHTGVAPFKGISGVNTLTGATLLAPDELKYRSGYEVFIHFRNWMKSYEQTKASPGNSRISDPSKLRMIFKNYKDWEFLIVEPLKFTMKKDASKPLLYNYVIQFTVLGHYKMPKVTPNILDDIDNGIKKVSAILDGTRAVFNKLSDVIRSTANTIDTFNEDLRKVNLAVKAAMGVKLTASDMSNRIESDFISQQDALKLTLKIGTITGTLANPATIASLERSGTDMTSIKLTGSAEQVSQQQIAISQGQLGSGNPKQDFLNAKAQLGSLISKIGIEDYPIKAQQELANEQAQATTISRQTIETILANGIRLRDQFADAIQLGDATYDQIFGVTSTSSTFTTLSDFDKQIEALYAFSQSILALETLLASDKLFDINASKFGQNSAASNYQVLGSGIFSFPDPNAGIKEGIIPFGASLEDIALVEFGDVSRWTELAELNGLKYPYIDSTGVYGSVVNSTINSESFYNPTQIQNLDVGSKFLVPSSPTPAGAWVGQAGRIASFNGGLASSTANWNFIYPNQGMTIKIQDSNIYKQFNDTWSVIDFEEIQTSEVLKPGDLIKIPIAQRPDNSTISRGPRDNNVTDGLSASEKALGVDLKLTNNGDLNLTPQGDLQLSFGTDNAAQAIILKLAYERGELKDYPLLGTNLKIGGKITDIGQIRTQIVTTLLQDSRIADVKNVNLQQSGSTVSVSFDVYLNNVQEPIPIVIPV